VRQLAAARPEGVVEPLCLAAVAVVHATGVKPERVN